MQLSLFETKQKQPHGDYWETMFGWIPEVGKLARIDAPIAYCETTGKNRYCYCMRVKILRKENGLFFVETTKEWENATSGSDKGGTVYKVKKSELAPILQ